MKNNVKYNYVGRMSARWKKIEKMRLPKKSETATHQALVG